LQILSSDPQPSGLTRITVDVDGIHRATVSLLTSVVHTVSDRELLTIVADAVARERPPLSR
jgi:hypothetical protein